MTRLEDVDRDPRDTQKRKVPKLRGLLTVVSVAVGRPS
jgi:hypothetical protein